MDLLLDLSATGLSLIDKAKTGSAIDAYKENIVLGCQIKNEKVEPMMKKMKFDKGKKDPSL